MISPRPAKDDLAAWPLFPLSLQNDIPFNHAEGLSLEGRAEDPSSHLYWAEKHGKLRTGLLRPINDPFVAAERLADSPLVKRLEGAFSDRDLLRCQAWNMVRHLVRHPIGQKETKDALHSDKDVDWKARKKLIAGLKIRWNEQRQEYVAE
jgi:hypothetical protein